MTYEKAVAERIEFDSSDVITTSDCPVNGWSHGCGQGGGCGNHGGN